MSGSPTLLVNSADPFARSGAARLSLNGCGRCWRRRCCVADPRRIAGRRRARRAPGDPACVRTGRPPVAAGSRRPRCCARCTNQTRSGSVPTARLWWRIHSPRPRRRTGPISDRTDVHAMCAIDALGISAMLGADTVVESVDGSTVAPVRVVTVAGRTTWDPAGAVVFVGADPCGGPSADCCCDYLNFFADRGAVVRGASGVPAGSSDRPRPKRSASSCSAGCCPPGSA